jgi:hypothetical protein
MKWSDLQSVLVVGGTVVIEDGQDDCGVPFKTVKGTIEEIDWNGDFPVVRLNNLRDGATGAPIPGSITLDFYDLHENGGLMDPVQLTGVVRFLHSDGLAGNFITAEFVPLVLGTEHTVPPGKLDMDTLKYQ